MEYKQTQIDEQQKDIDKTVKRNKDSVEQICSDRDEELKTIEKKNDGNVLQVKDMALKSKAEYQLMINRLGDIQRENENEDTKCRDLAVKIEKQEGIMLQHRTDIDELQKQITKKDKKIGDHESKIYQLKKKTQELEKFKFVLDYKIRDIKKDISPKEVETTRLRAETNEKDRELRAYNQVNASLGFMVEDLRTRQENMQECIKLARDSIRRNESYIRSYKNAVYWVAQNIDDFEQLKKSVD
jgi:chromosome segregation ATPase